MTRRNRSAGRRKSKGMSLKKVAALAALPAAAIIGGGTLLAVEMRRERMNEQYCFARADQPVHAIAIDASFTAQSSSQQLRDYATAIERAYEDAEPNTRIEFFSTGRHVSGSIARPIASICKPAASADELEALGAPGQTDPRQQQIAGEARAEYEALSARVLDDLQNEDLAAEDSPVLELLQGISRYPEFEGLNRRLTLITDGIQNSEIARFCMVEGDMPPYERFAQRREFDYVRPDPFTGTRVEVLLVESGTLPSPQLPYCSNNEMRDWWPAYFRDNGAGPVGLTRLRYGAE